MRIAMPRGDVKWVRFLINTSNGTSTDLDFTNIYFTVKKNSKDRMFLFQKSLKRNEIYKLGLGDYQLKIDPSDTNKLAIGDYKFDIQISYKNLLKESFVGDFILKEEITYYENEDYEEEETDYSLPHTSDGAPIVLSIPDYHLLELSTPIPTVTSDNDYEHLLHIPTINGVPLVGNLSLEDLGITGGQIPVNPDDPTPDPDPSGDEPQAFTPEELEEIINGSSTSEPQAFTTDELEEIINGGSH